MEIELPSVIADLVVARNRVRDHYNGILHSNGNHSFLRFTFDGNLVGDIGEALAVEYFGIRLVDNKANPGVDGYAPDGRSVQVKTTGTKRGPVFRRTEFAAEHLLFFEIDFDACKFAVVYNGPEAPVVNLLPENWSDQRTVPRQAVEGLNHKLADSDRLLIKL